MATCALRACTNTHSLRLRARVIAGGMALIAPTFTGKLFLIPAAAMTPMSAYQLRLFGIRDAVIGELTWLHRPAFRKPLDEGDRKQLRTILLANVATDATDVVVTAAAMAMGAIGRNAALAIGGGAVTFLSLGLVGLAKL